MVAADIWEEKIVELRTQQDNKLFNFFYCKL